MRCKFITGFPSLISTLSFILQILFIYLGGLDIVCKAIVTGQATSLDHSSHGLLSVMQELTSKASRREPSRSLTAIGENDWTKRMINFAPYGQFLCFVLVLVLLYAAKMCTLDSTYDNSIYVN